MDNSPTTVPGRQLSLDRLIGAVNSDLPRSSVVLITGASGSGSTTFTRQFVALCAPGRAVDVATVRQVTGLPWARHRAGDGVSALAEEQVPDDPGDAARLLVGSVEPSGRRWDCAVVVSNAHLVDRLTIESLLSSVRMGAVRSLLIVLDWTEPLHPGSPLSSHRHEDSAQDNLYDDVRAAADHVVDLGPLTPDDVTVLAEQFGVLVPTAEIAHLVRHTDGNTRSIAELLREVSPGDWAATSLALPAPSSVRRAVRARLAALPDEGRRLVNVIAVLEEADRLNGRVQLRAAAEVVGGGVTAQTVAQVLNSELVVPLDAEATMLRIRDTVTGRAVVDEVGPAIRAAIHSRAAEVVDDPAAALRHRWYCQDLPDDDLADLLAEQAAREAVKGAWASTGELLYLAARATSDPDLAGSRLVGATDALVGAGDVPGASRHLAELESLRETPQRNAVLGYLAVVRGRSGEADGRLRRAWELVNPRRDPASASVVAQRHVLHSLANCQAEQLVSWADKATELAAAGTPAAIEATAIRGLGSAVIDSPASALDGYAALIAALPEDAVAARVRMAAGWLHLAADDPQRARDELERAVPTDHLGGSLRISLWARAWLARVQFLTGDWTAALHTATTGAAMAENSGMSLLVPLLQWTRAQVHTLRGEWAMADRCLRLGSVSQHDYPIMRVPAALGQAALHEARADYPAVVRALAFLTEPWAAEWIGCPGFWPWADVYANALVVSGRLDEADRFLRPHEKRASSAGHVSTLARLGYARGRWHGQTGDLESARASFTDAIDLISRLPFPYDLARAHFAFGQTLRRAGRRAEADAVLTSARDQFARLGATTYVRRCDRELAAGGVNAPRSTDAHSDVLTPQESAVAALVAQGRTNKEVAAELFLSVKTVQYHLTRTYAKLGVRSRSQLASQWPTDDTPSPSPKGPQTHRQAQ